MKCVQLYLSAEQEQGGWLEIMGTSMGILPGVRVAGSGVKVARRVGAGTAVRVTNIPADAVSDRCVGVGFPLRPTPPII